MLSHVRVLKSAAGRAWCGSPGKRVCVENHTLCGDPVTDRDVRLSKSGKLSKADAEWVTCPKCRAALQLPAKSPLGG